jgi:hypothetical protein
VRASLGCRERARATTLGGLMDVRWEVLRPDGKNRTNNLEFIFWLALRMRLVSYFVD